jgi:hypothetical protein
LVKTNCQPIGNNIFTKQKGQKKTTLLGGLAVMD